MGIGDICSKGGDQVGGVRVGPLWWPRIVGVKVVVGASGVMIGDSLFFRTGVVWVGVGVL